MSKTFSCGNTHADIGEIRGCSGCQADGTAGRIHAAMKDSDPVEAMPGHNQQAAPSAPAATPTPTPAPQQAPKAKRARKPKAKTKPKAKAKAKKKSKR